MPIFGGRSVSGGSGTNPQDYTYTPVSPPAYAPAAPAAPPPRPTQVGTSRRYPAPRAARPNYSARRGDVRITSSSTRGDIIQRTRTLSERDANSYVADALNKGASTAWDKFISPALKTYEAVWQNVVNRPFKAIQLATNPRQESLFGKPAEAWRAADNVSAAQSFAANPVSMASQLIPGANLPLAGILGPAADRLRRAQDEGLDLADAAQVDAFNQQDRPIDNLSTGAVDFLFSVGADPLYIAGKASKVTKLTYFGRRAEALDNLTLERSLDNATAGQLDPLTDPWHALADQITTGRRVSGEPAPYDRAALLNLDVVRRAANPERAADFLAESVDSADAVVRLAHLRGVGKAQEILLERNPNAYFEAVAAEAAARPFLSALEPLKGERGAGWRYTPEEGFQWQSWVPEDAKQAVLDSIQAPVTEADLALAIRINEEARAAFEAQRRARDVFNTSTGGRAYGRIPSTADPTILDRAATVVDKVMGANRAGRREAAKAGKELRRADTYWYGQPEATIWKVPGLSRTVAEIKRGFDEMPNGYVPFKGAGAEDAVPSVKASIRNVPVYTGREFRRKETTWADGQVMTGGERGRWLLGEWTRRAANTGVTREEGLRRATLWLDQQIWDDLVAAKGFSGRQAEFAMAEYQKVRKVFNNNITAATKSGGFHTDVDEAGNPRSVYDPVFASQMDNGVMLLDHRQAWEIMDDPAVARLQGYEYSGLQQAKNTAVKAGDAFMDVWKPLVLLRAAYPIRNTFEAETRFLASAGGVLRYLEAISTRGQSKRPDEAASAARRAMDNAVRDMDAFDADLGKITLPALDQMPMAPAELRALAEARNQLRDEIDGLLARIQETGSVDTPAMIEARKHPALVFEQAIGNGATGMMPIGEFALREAPNGIDPGQVTRYADALENGEGFDKPILMALDPDTGEVRLVDGVHRALAAERVGISHIPVRVIVGRGATGPLVRKVNTRTLAKADPEIEKALTPGAPWDPALARPSDTTAMPLPGGAFALPDGSRLVQARVKGKLAQGYQRAVLDKDDTWAREDTIFATPEEAAFEAQARMVAEWTAKVNDTSIPALPAEVAFPGHRWTARTAPKMWDQAQAALLKQRAAELKFSGQYESTLGRRLDLARGRLEEVDARTQEILQRMGFIDPNTGDLALDWEYLGRPMFDRQPNALTEAGQQAVDDATPLPDPNAAGMVAAYAIPEETRNLLAKWANTLLIKADLRAAGRAMARQVEYFDAMEAGKLGRGKFKMRRGTGMSSFVDQAGHRYEYGGLFADSRAGRMVEQEVSSEGTNQAFSSSAAYNAAYKKAGRDFTVLKNKQISPDMDNYWDEFAKLVNHHWRGDQAMGILLRTDPQSLTAVQHSFPEFYEFIKSKAGGRYIDLFDLTSLPKARAWWLEAGRRVNQYLPNNPELRAKIARGEEVTGDELAAGLDFGDNPPPTITGDIVETMPGSQTMAKGRLLGKIGYAKDKAFHIIGTIPEDYFLRRPYTNWAFEKHMRQLIDQRGGTHIRTDELEDMRQTATKLAIRDSRRDLYTIVRKRRAFEAIRFGAAFAEAQYNSLAFWTRTMSENPDYVARLLQVAALPAENGLIDDEGNVAVPIPSFIGSKLPGSPDVMSISMSALTSLYFNTGNAENPIVGGLLPSPTPLVAVPASEFAKAPPGQWVLSKIGDEGLARLIETQLIGDSTTAEPFSWNRMAPAWAPKLAHLVFGSEADPYMMAAQIQAFEIDHIKWQMEGGVGKEPMPADQKYKDQAEGMAMLRIFTNLFSPLGVQWGNAEHKRASSLYQSLVEAYSPQEADQIILQMYPEYVGLFASANDGGGIASRAATNTWIKQNEGELAKIGEVDPEALSMIVPWDDGEFQSAAYTYQKSNKVPGSDKKMRGTVTAEEAEAAWQAKLGRTLYRIERDRLAIEKQQYGIQPNTAGSAHYKAMLDDYVDGLKAKLPGFQKEWDDGAVKQARPGQGLAIFRAIAGSEKLAQDPQTQQLVESTREYLNARDVWVEKAVENGQWHYEQNAATRAGYETMVESLERFDPQFSRLYGYYFYWDDMTLRSDGSIAQKGSN